MAELPVDRGLIGIFCTSKESVDGSGVDLYISPPFVFQSSSMVEHAAVNRVVVGSSPTSGANSNVVDGRRWLVPVEVAEPTAVREDLAK